MAPAEGFEPPKARGKGRPIHPGSNVHAAKEVLTTVGRPTHIDAILPAVEKIVGKKVSKATLVGQISEYVRRAQVFTRPEPSTFGLLSWDTGNGHDNGNGKAKADPFRGSEARTATT